MTELNFSETEMKRIRHQASQRGATVEQVVTDCVVGGMQEITCGFRGNKAEVTNIRFRKE